MKPPTFAGFEGEFSVPSEFATAKIPGAAVATTTGADADAPAGGPPL
jgi:hypothetical protein